jgi:phage gp36-like protein
MYCTLEDLEARLESVVLTALADDDGDGIADACVVAAAIADAASEIDAALGGRYAVPLAAAPPIIRAIGAWLAIASLFRRRRETPSPEHAAQGERARALLRLLAQGQILLAGVASRSVPTSNRTADTKVHRPETFENL